MRKIFATNINNNASEPIPQTFFHNQTIHQKDLVFNKLTEKQFNRGDKSSVASSAKSETKLLRVVHSIYKRWAYFIVNHSIFLIALCTIVTIICTIKVVITPYKNNITGYTPYGARSLNELAIREEFFGQYHDGPSFGPFVLIMGKKNENLLNLELLDEIVKIDEIVRTNITMFNHVTNRSEGYYQFCEDFCDINEPIRNFYVGYKIQLNQTNNHDQLFNKIDLKYPVSTIFGRKFSIQPNFYGLQFSNNKSDITNIKSIKMIALVYKAERVGKWSNEEVKTYEMEISHYLEKVYKSDHLKVMTVSTTYAEVEIVRAGLSMLPFLIFGFLIMAVCSTVTVLFSATYMQQVNIHKVTLAIMACVCPFMACGTALGLLFFCGVRFGSVLCVTPFLVLAIGVDDAYLMIHSWQRVSKQMQKNLSKDDCVAHRLSLVLIDTGPAILISALTNITADAVGSFTGSPEITLLCIGNMASIFCDFIYQITFYSSILAVVGYFEMRKEIHDSHKLSIFIGGSVLAINDSSNHYKKIGYQKESFHDKVKRKFEKFVNDYVNFITNGCVAFITCLLWLLFISFCLVGIFKFEVNLTSKKLFAEDSPLLVIDHYREEHIVPFYTMATVFVNNPGNLTDLSRLNRLNLLVEEMERLPESWGPESTNYFLREFLAYKKSIDEIGEIDQEQISNNTTFINTSLINLIDFNFNELPTFLQWPENNYWRGFLRYKSDKNKITLKSFFFTTAYHGNKLSNWFERMQLFNKWRKIVDTYPEFNASIYHEEGIFMDLVDNMPTDAWQSALATLVCISAICFIFMFNVNTVCVATAIIGSIIIGMLGLLSWQGVSMDPIMMAALIISIGFSVDIPAHVAYHYYSSAFETTDSLTVKDRLKITFASVGFPAIQASLSTSLCVLSLLFVKLYMAKIFVQIMCLCLLMCIIHSLVILPAIFSLIKFIQTKLFLNNKSNNFLSENSLSHLSTSNNSASNICIKQNKLMKF